MDRWTGQLRDVWMNSFLPVVAFFLIWSVTFLFFYKGIGRYSSDVSIFRIVYMAFALFCIISFQFSRDFWQKMIVRFWTFVIIYEIFVFVAVFLFQITSIRNFCRNIGLTSKWEHDIGLAVFNLNQLLFYLFSEISIIFVVILLQLLLDKAPPVTSLPFEQIDKMVEFLDTFFDITILTIFGIIMTCITKVNAIHFCFIIAAVLSMVLKRTIRYLIIQLISVSAAILLGSQMIMQLHFFSDVKNVTCVVSDTENVTLSKGAWLGFGKIDPNEIMLFNVMGYICIIILVTFYTIIVKERNIIQGLKQESGWNPYKMFSDPTYLEAGRDFISYIKYLMKYGFYRYGIELTLICIAMLIQARLDVWALIYSIWLMILVLCRHSVLIRVWPAFKYFVLISIPFQYAAALGYWPEKCFGYELAKSEMLKNAYDWLFLPIGKTKPDALKLFWDSLVFLFVLCQTNVFDFERKHANGDFSKIPPPVTLHANSETLISPTTTFGLIRYAVCCSLLLISAITFFFAATAGITLFSIGYGIGFFLILWLADNYYLRPVEQTIQFWKYLLIYNVFTILIKTALQIPGCIYMSHLVGHWCWLVQLLGITCLKLNTKTIAFFNVPLLSTAEKATNSCWYFPTYFGIEWDILCFMSLIFHERFLRSVYFSEMSQDAVLDVKFSNRAAKILEHLNKEKLREMRDKYTKNMEKIQRTMARLKEVQKRIRGLKIAEPSTHQEAVTSGDYYMFDDIDKGLKLSTEVEEEEGSKTRDECGMCPSTPNVGKLMEAVMKTDIEQALKIAESGSSSSDQSSPVSSADSQKLCECTCKTTEIAKVTATLKEKKDGQETTEKLKKPIKERRTVPPAVIIVKNEKLLPTVNFDRRKSLKQPKMPTKIVKSTEEKVKPKCICGRENCRCPFRYLMKIFNAVCIAIRFAIAFINGCMISLCQIFNEIAYDYKYVKKQLLREKRASKITLMSPMFYSGSMVVTSDKEKTDLSYQVPIFIRFLISVYDVIMSSFNTICFLSVLLLQMRHPTIFTIPSTMMVLLWGSLSVPRPTKRFWKVLLIYISVLLVLENILRIQVVQFDLKTFDYKYLQLQLFDEQNKNERFSCYYLIIVLAIFLQRRRLMNFGMWNDESKPRRRGHIFRLFFSSLKSFYKKLIYENHDRIPVDVYTLLFLCDFINIFVFIFGFSSITEKREDGVSRYFYENKIPPAMLVLFVAQCFGVFIDRWIYLRRHVLAKFIFQVVQIFIVHLCCFALLPAITYRSIKFNEMFFPSLWYALKSIYFLLSAYQIRRGYPTSLHGHHALCQSYSVVNLYLYEIYLSFPFVYELRTLTDWMWTETTLTATEWIGMEDIFSTVFLLKCWRNYDTKYSYKRGQKITSTTKFMYGGGMVFLFFILLLFPLVFFTFGRVAGKVNLPLQMKLTFRVGSYEPIYYGYSTNINSITTQQWNQLQDLYLYSPRAMTLLSEYYPSDIGVVYLSIYSQQEWNLNPIFKDRLINELKSNSSPSILAEWKLNRKSEDLKQPIEIIGSRRVKLKNTACDVLLGILQGNDTAKSFVAMEAAPKFLKIGNLATTTAIDSLMNYADVDGGSHPKSAHMNVSFQPSNNTADLWQIKYNYPDGWSAGKIFDEIILQDKANSSEDLLIFTFNDKIFLPGLFSYFSAQGIFGLYTTFLLSIGYVVRRCYRGRANQVFLDHIPNVDSILQLLLDIYFVREHKDSRLEEDLYAKLIFLFRSPETLIRWTRASEESD